jgi:small subunit ribosomal protein S13
MARIAGVNLPNHQHAEIALTAIYGIGRSRAQKICVDAGVVRSTKIKDLSDAEMDGCASRSAGTRSKAICAAKSR